LIDEKNQLLMLDYTKCNRHSQLIKMREREKSARVITNKAHTITIFDKIVYSFTCIIDIDYTH
jgi:hypothetical protein